MQAVGHAQGQELTPETCLHASKTTWVWTGLLGETVETNYLGGLFGQEELPWTLTSLLEREVLPCLLSLISYKSGCEPVPKPASTGGGS